MEWKGKTKLISLIQIWIYTKNQILFIQVNMQDCSHGIGDLDFDLDNIKKWEHLLPGEPLVRRKIRKRELEEEETNEMYDEKHLDMPISWSIRISIPHDGKHSVSSSIV